MADLTYNGYTGSANVSIQDECLHGRILFIDDIITYEGSTVEELNCAFKEAVDDYISYCKRTGKSPNKPYSGSFNIRIGPELHKKSAEAAHNAGVALNEFITKAVQERIENNGITKIEHTHKHVVIAKEDSMREVRIATSTPPLLWEAMNATTQH
ncbi:MAG: type II toxin-antitoxin system HicB family antitoxin [Methylotenera sp.]|nr:type II toxin-antitoxin system HicB family antitoxin [Methylotenera sp.]MDD4925538.1 type II toxin-antitoxin system HicB family antitoxin [Methylotenera sp.]